MTTALRIPIADYARDLVGAPHPTLNSSVARLLIERSPWHAWYAHPRLNPDWQERTPSNLMNIGSAAHAVLLEGDTERIVAIDAPDWRTGAAKERRDAALAAGRIPLLREDAEVVIQMVGEAQAALSSSPDLAGLGELATEETYVWPTEHSGLTAWLRCRPDAVTRDGAVILSYKTTSTIAHPETYVRTMLDGGFDIQMAIEMAGVEDAYGRKPRYVWVVQEMQPPFAVSLIGPAGDMLAYGGQRLDEAVGIWARCLADGPEPENWPGYPPHIVAAHVPAWRMREMEELS